jgi:hypothetical protein
MRKAAWPMYAANKEGNTKAVKAICNTKQGIKHNPIHGNNSPSKDLKATYCWNLFIFD